MDRALAFAGLLVLGCGGGTGRHPGPAGNTARLFAAGTSYDLELEPSGIALGDVDGDGRLDVLLVSRGDLLEFRGGVTVLLGDGEGRFGPPIHTLVERAPVALGVGDVDGDGHLDVVTANLSSADVGVLRGDGRGGFEVSSFEAGVRPTAVALADVDGDGRLDVAVANAIDNGRRDVSVLLNLGGGAFAPPVTLDVDGSPTDIAAGDVDGDGRAEIFVTTTAEQLYQLTFPVTGVSRPAESIAPAVGPSALADVNGDGTADLAISAHQASGTGHILFGDGSGGWSAPIEIPGRASWVGFADLSGDGKPELLFVDPTTVHLAANFGNGFFAAPAGYLAGAAIVSAALGDVDGDDLADLVVADRANGDDGHAGRIHVLLSAAPGRLRGPVLLGLGPVIAFEDMDGDGIADLVGRRDSVVAVLPSYGGGDFGEPVAADARAGGELAFGDLDGDGDRDLIAREAVDTVDVLLNDGRGSLALAHRFDGPVMRGMLLADLDGDRDDDLLGIVDASVVVLRNRGDGSFDAASAYPCGGVPVALAVADVNGDGRADAVLADAERALVVILAGDGEGRFAPAREVELPSAGGWLALGDVDADGAVDIVIGIASSSEPTIADRIAVLLNDGHGAFGPAAEQPLASGIGALVLGDVDGDGRLDAVVSEPNQGRVTVLSNDGHGHLMPPVATFIGGEPTGLVLGDVDGDGLLDLGVGLQDDAVLLWNAPPASGAR